MAQKEALLAVPALLAILRAKRALKQLYGLSGSRCSEYDSGDLKQTPTRAATETYDMRTALNLTSDAQGKALYEVFKRELKSDDADLNPATESPKKGAARKRARSGSELPMSTSKRRRTSTRKGRPKKSSDDEDDAEDDLHELETGDPSS